MTIIGTTVYAGFGGMCDSYNFTGYIVGVGTQSASVKTIFATISGPDSIPQDGTWQGGGVSSELLLLLLRFFTDPA